MLSRVALTPVLLSSLAALASSQIAAPSTSTPGGPVEPGANVTEELLPSGARASTIRDRAQPGRGLEASSNPEFGVLFPYPGRNNSFDPNQSSTISGGEANLTIGKWTTVSGGYSNTATRYGATVGGGYDNTAVAAYSTVGGGFKNRVAYYATVAGGGTNTANGTYASIGGGRLNLAGGFKSTIGGGESNWATNAFTNVTGGRYNTASGSCSTIAGGDGNRTLGNYSFAAGRNARAAHRGSFVWGDADGAVKSSSTPNQFNIYASGGLRFFTNAEATTGVLLAAGGGTWSSVSDRNAKENVEAVDPQGVLAEVLAMPISTWNYETQNDEVRHMGPMAQDFHAAFGLGVSDKMIDSVDPDGVALAAIQGLHLALEERDAEIAALRSDQESLRNELQALRAMLRASPDAQ